MKHQSFVLFLVAIVSLLAPTSVWAQSSAPQVNTLLVELWPEYDRPEVLVIYRGELTPTTSLPTRLTFRLPGYIQEMHAVAVEEDGALLNVDPASIQLQHEGDALIFSFPVSAPGFQFEYYDSEILTRQEQDRRLAYQFTAPYSIEKITFELQQPRQAQNFTLTPPPDRTFDQNGFTFSVVEKSSLAAGDLFELSATYSRPTDEVSVPNLPASEARVPGDISVVSESPVDDSLNLGYFLVGAGVVLLLGMAVYWLWSRRLSAETAPRSGPHPQRGGPGRRRREQTGQRRIGPARQFPSPSARPPGSFCYRCGTTLREDAEFCHACGAPRRRE